MLDERKSPKLRDGVFADLFQSGSKISTLSVSIDLVMRWVVFESHFEESTSEPLLCCAEVWNCTQSNLCVEMFDKIEMQAVSLSVSVPVNMPVQHLPAFQSFLSTE
jgi:hypothetical protein